MSLGQQLISSYLQELGDKSSTPGGGAVAALTGAQAAGLISMVAQFSEKTLAPDTRTTVLSVSQSAIEAYTALADQDATNFKALMASYKTGEGIQAALQAAATPPLQCLDLAIELKQQLIPLQQDGNPNLVTDTGIAAILLKSTITASKLNILINLRSIKDTNFIRSAQQAIESAEAHIVYLDQLAEEIQQQLL